MELDSKILGRMINSSPQQGEFLLHVHVTRQNTADRALSTAITDLRLDLNM